MIDIEEVEKAVKELKKLYNETNTDSEKERILVLQSELFSVAGLGFFLQEKYRDAVKYFKRAEKVLFYKNEKEGKSEKKLVFPPLHKNILYLMADSYFNLRKYDKAIKCCQKLLEIKPNAKEILSMCKILMESDVPAIKNAVDIINEAANEAARNSNFALKVFMAFNVYLLKMDIEGMDGTFVVENPLLQMFKKETDKLSEIWNFKSRFILANIYFIRFEGLLKNRDTRLSDLAKQKLANVQEQYSCMQEVHKIIEKMDNVDANRKKWQETALKDIKGKIIFFQNFDKLGLAVSIKNGEDETYRDREKHAESLLENETLCNRYPSIKLLAHLSFATALMGLNRSFDGEKTKAAEKHLEEAENILKNNSTLQYENTNRRLVVIYEQMCKFYFYGRGSCIDFEKTYCYYEKVSNLIDEAGLTEEEKKGLKNSRAAFYINYFSYMGKAAFLQHNLQQYQNAHSENEELLSKIVECRNAGIFNVDDQEYKKQSYYIEFQCRVSQINQLILTCKVAQQLDELDMVDLILKEIKESFTRAIKIVKENDIGWLEDLVDNLDYYLKVVKDEQIFRLVDEHKEVKDELFNGKFEDSNNETERVSFVKAMNLWLKKKTNLHSQAVILYKSKQYDGAITTLKNEQRDLAKDFLNLSKGDKTKNGPAIEQVGKKIAISYSVAASCYRDKGGTENLQQAQTACKNALKYEQYFHKGNTAEADALDKIRKKLEGINKLLLQQGEQYSPQAPTPK